MGSPPAAPIHFSRCRPHLTLSAAGMHPCLCSRPCAAPAMFPVRSANLCTAPARPSNLLSTAMPFVLETCRASWRLRPPARNGTSPPWTAGRERCCTSPQTTGSWRQRNSWCAAAASLLQCCWPSLLCMRIVGSQRRCNSQRLHAAVMGLMNTPCRLGRCVSPPAFG